MNVVPDFRMTLGVEASSYGERPLTAQRAH